MSKGHKGSINSNLQLMGFSNSGQISVSTAQFLGNVLPVYFVFHMMQN